MSFNQKLPRGRVITVALEIELTSETSIDEVRRWIRSSLSGREEIPCHVGRIPTLLDEPDVVDTGTRLQFHWNKTGPLNVPIIDKVPDLSDVCDPTGVNDKRLVNRRDVAAG